MRIGWTVLLCGLALAVAPAGVSAQAVVVNPTIVQFTPSADHSTINPLDGLPVVLRYEVRVYQPTAPGVVVASQDLGKPAIGTDGTIQATLSAAFATAVVAAAKNTKLIARVAAIGQYGAEGLSDPTDVAKNPFGYVGPPDKPTNVIPKK